MTGESYERLLEALLDEVEAALCLRAARRFEKAIEERARRENLDTTLRFVGERLLVQDENDRVLAFSFEDRRAEQAIASLPEQEGLRELARRALALRRRHARLRERRRLRDRLHAIESDRNALQRLSASEIAEAETARKRLLRRRRRRREPISNSLRRAVPEVVIERARALIRAHREIERALQDHEACLAHETSPLEERDQAVLDRLEQVARLLRVVTRSIYEPFAERLLARYRELALSRSGTNPDQARRFLRDLAFLMAKANFEPLETDELERGFCLGPAPGVRLRLPLDQFALACFFVRGKRLEPTHHGELAPHYDKFTFCLLERDLAARTESERPRRRGSSTRFGRMRERLRRWWHSRRRRLLVRLARRHRRVIAPRIDRVAGYLARLSALPPPELAVDPALKIKLFRDVRLGEIGLVLPGARIRYRLFDLVLVWGGATSGFLAKVAQKPLGMLLAPKILLSLLVAVIGRGLLGLRRSRTTLDRLQESYENAHLQATRMHAVQYFVREAVETDSKEMLVLYALALEEAIDDGRLAEGGTFTFEPDRVDVSIARFMREHFRARSNFDLLDAIGGLEALELLPRPGVLARGDSLPSYFDERFVGESFRKAAITRWVERAFANEPSEGVETENESKSTAPLAASAALPKQIAVLDPNHALSRLRRRAAELLGLE